MKRTSIFKGFIAVFAKSAAPTVEISTEPVQRRAAAPASVITQYEPIRSPPSFILGKNSTAHIIAMQVSALMVIVSVIFCLVRF